MEYDEKKGERATDNIENFQKNAHGMSSRRVYFWLR